MKPQNRTERSMNMPKAPVKALMQGLIDYAGLFPPAALSMADAVQEYLRCRASEHGWILGRFVVPAAHLSAFTNSYTGSRDNGPGGGGAEPRIGVSLITEPGQIQLLAPNASIESIELKYVPDQPLLLPKAPAGCEVYVEMSPQHLALALPEIRKAEARAKLRTGGVQAAMIPALQDVCDFLAACAALKLPFKATAGLHHALRSSHPLTYEPTSPKATMHGFLNVFLAACLLWHQKIQPATALELLQETDWAALSLTEEAILWRAYSLSTTEIESARQNFAISYGSCSFREPIEELLAAGWLETGAGHVL